MGRTGNGEWSDTDCSLSREYVCKKPLPASGSLCRQILTGAACLASMYPVGNFTNQRRWINILNSQNDSATWTSYGKRFLSGSEQEVTT
jgi:hypothetical protein